MILGTVDAAKFLDISPNEMRKLIYNGVIPHQKVGSVFIMFIRHLEQYLAGAGDVYEQIEERFISVPEAITKFNLSKSEAYQLKNGNGQYIRIGMVGIVRVSGFAPPSPHQPGRPVIDESKDHLLEENSDGTWGIAAHPGRYNFRRKSQARYFAKQKVGE